MQSDRTSVLVIHHRDLASPIGSTFFYYVSNGLAASDDVHVVCRRRGGARDDASDHEGVLYDIDTGEVPILSGLLFHCLASLYAAYLAITNRYDVTVCSQSSMIQGWIASRLGGSRYVVGLCSVPVRQAADFRAASGDDPSLRSRVSTSMLSLYSRAVRVLLGRATDVVCLTDGIVEVTERVYDIDLGDPHVIGMGVDVETFARPAGHEESSASGEPWTITYIGAVRETRNLEQVIEAMAVLEADVRFRIAGQGPDADVEALLETASRVGVSDQVEWLGFVPHESIPDVLWSTDFAVSPLPDIESYRISFPAKLLEYMAAGTVVVATDIPAHRSLIEDGENGLLYDGRRDDLAETIADGIDDVVDLRGIRRRAVETARRRTWDRVVADFRDAVVDPVPRNAGPRHEYPNQPTSSAK